MTESHAMSTGQTGTAICSCVDLEMLRIALTEYDSAIYKGAKTGVLELHS